MTQAGSYLYAFLIHAALWRFAASGHWVLFYLRGETGCFSLGVTSRIGTATFAGGRVYSVRRAMTGSFLAALRAGIRPPSMVMSTLMTTRIAP